MSVKRRVLSWLAAWAYRAAVVLGLLGLGGALVVVFGLAPINASSGHWKITELFLHFAMKQSVKTHSMGLAPPFSLDDPRRILLGASAYETGCRFCHGAPGSPMPVIPQQMTPHAPELRHAVHEHEPRALFYIVRHGVKFTGMPAWPALEREDEVWAMVAFLRKYPSLDAAGYRSLVFGDAPSSEPTEAPAVVTRTCARCHGIDGLARGTGAFPRLAAQRGGYLRVSLEAYARGDRHSGIMRPLAAPLSPAEIDAAVAWYASRPPPPPTGASSALGATIATEGIPSRKIPACVGCHKPGDDDAHPEYPRLEGQFAVYLEQQLTLFEKGTRGGGRYVSLMKQAVVEHTLAAEEVRAVAQYFASSQAASTTK